MTKQEYSRHRFQQKSKVVLDQVTQIIEYFQSSGYKMSLRQLYYQLVKNNIIQNTKQDYKRISELLKNARMSGIADWDFIEDRHREAIIPHEFDSLKDFVEVAIPSFRLPRWEGQTNYVEVWVEKAALRGILEPIARRYHVSLIVNKGFSSTTFMRQASMRFKSQLTMGKRGHILYLGDHDPSGKDMVRDIKQRLEDFSVGGINVLAVALTREQVQQYQLPDNQLKRKKDSKEFADPRADKYAEAYGDKSWELDALSPEALTEILSTAIEALLNLDMYQKVIEKEELDKERLRRQASNSA